MNRYDQGAALAAQARELLDQRLSGVRTTSVEFATLYGIPISAVQAKVKTPTLLEKLEKEAADLENSLASVSAQLAKRQVQIEELKRYPEDDPYEDDTVLRFKKSFPGGDKKYTYTAHKTEGLWYVSGDKAPNGVEWPELVAFLGLGVNDVYKIAPGRAAKVAWSEVK